MRPSALNNVFCFAVALADVARLILPGSKATLSNCAVSPLAIPESQVHSAGNLPSMMAVNCKQIHLLGGVITETP